MSAPTYVAKKIGDEYVLVRSDTSELITRAGAVVGGAFLIWNGITRSGFLAVAASVGGAALAYRGWTGRNPLDLLISSGGPRHGDPNHAPSYRDEGMGSGQMPTDAVDEAAMESFPASDPPAMRRSAAQPGEAGGGAV